MSPLRTSLQKVFLECLKSMLDPIVRLTLHCGLGYSEFSAILRQAFIDVATTEFGVRGRPANVAKISAITGLPRKVVRRSRTNEDVSDWSPDNEASPINTIIHYWIFDPDFCDASGNARDLSYEGPGSFADLAKRYGGDIPVSTIRSELLRAGIASRTANGELRLERRYSFPEHLDEDFLRNAAFSIRHHVETLVHNASLVRNGYVTESDHRKFGRFERFAWSRRLNAQESEKLQQWARFEGAAFLERADDFIAEREAASASDDPRAISGIGVYFFTRMASEPQPERPSSNPRI